MGNSTSQLPLEAPKDLSTSVKPCRVPVFADYRAFSKLRLLWMSMGNKVEDDSLFNHKSLNQLYITPLSSEIRSTAPFNEDLFINTTNKQQ